MPMLDHLIEVKVTDDEGKVVFLLNVPADMEKIILPGRITPGLRPILKFLKKLL